jgi:acetyl esterase/lipase
MNTRPLVIVLLLAGLAGPACYKGNNLFPPAAHSVYDVPYAKGYPGEDKLVLDIHYPDQAKDLPIIVYIHGGGWNAGDKSQMDVWSKRMSNCGYVVFNINYRLAPEHPFPDAINDCLGALAWIRHHAPEYGGDPSRLGVTGGSAGGHLTALVSTANGAPGWKPTGFESESLAGIVKVQVPFFGVYDFHRKDFIAASHLNRKFLGGKADESPENYQLASPVTYVRKNVPPTLMFCGMLDPIYNQSNLYYRALKIAGADVTYVRYPLETHAFECLMWSHDSKDAFKKMMAFFDQHLKK